MRAHWFFERAMWAAMALVIILALLGFLGTGPLSRADATASSGNATLRVEYPRWSRLKNVQRMEIQVAAPGTSGDELELVVSSNFVQHVRIKSIDPAPDGSSVSAEGHVYRWPVQDWSSPVSITIDYSPQKWRTLSARVIARAGGRSTQEVGFTQYVLP
jgi:hypothetical protein